MPSCRMSDILTYVRVALATSDVQSTLEIPESDEIHMEDYLNLVEQQHIQHATQSTELYKSGGTRRSRTIKGGINLYIELQKHKLDQIAARNMRISLEKRIAFSKLKLRVSEEKHTRANIGYP